MDLKEILTKVVKEAGKEVDKKVKESAFSLLDLLKEVEKGRKPVAESKFFPFKRVIPKDDWYDRRFRCSECARDFLEDDILLCHLRDKTVPACPNCKTLYKSWKPEDDDPVASPTKSFAMMVYTVHRECGRRHDPNTPCEKYIHKPIFSDIPFLHSFCKSVHGAKTPCSQGTPARKSAEQLFREKKVAEIKGCSEAELRYRINNLKKLMNKSQEDIRSLHEMIEAERAKQSSWESDISLMEKLLRK